MSPLAAVKVNVATPPAAQPVGQNTTLRNSVRPRCAACTVPSTTTVTPVSGVPVITPGSDPESFHGRSVPLAAALAGDAPSAANNSTQTISTPSLANRILLVATRIGFSYQRRCYSSTCLI